MGDGNEPGRFLPDLELGYNLIRTPDPHGEEAENFKSFRGAPTGPRKARADDRLRANRNLELTGSTMSGFRIQRYAPVRNDGVAGKGQMDV